MAVPRSREYITLAYDPGRELTPAYHLELMRRVEQLLQRLEGRIEALQDALDGLAARVTALEP